MSKPLIIRKIKRHPMNGWRFMGVTTGIGRAAMGEGAYDPGHFGVRHKLGRILEGDELERRKAELMERKT